MIPNPQTPGTLPHIVIGSVVLALIAFLAFMGRISDGEIVSLVMAVLGVSTAVTVSQQSRSTELAKQQEQTAQQALPLAIAAHTDQPTPPPPVPGQGAPGQGS